MARSLLAPPRRSTLDPGTEGLRQDRGDARAARGAGRPARPGGGMVVGVGVIAGVECVAMGPEQIAGVMSQVRRGQAARAGVPVDEEEDATTVALVDAGQEEGSLALRATGAVGDDGIIDPRDTRTGPGLCLSVVANGPVEGAQQFGVFRL